MESKADEARISLGTAVLTQSGPNIPASCCGMFATIAGSPRKNLRQELDPSGHPIIDHAVVVVAGFGAYQPHIWIGPAGNFDKALRVGECNHAIIFRVKHESRACERRCRRD